MQGHERLRVERSLRREIAETAGMSVPHLSDLERGRTNPGLETLQTLAESPGITVHELLEGVEVYGAATEAALPRGLAGLVADPAPGGQVTPDWVRTPTRTRLSGKRPQARGDWYEISLHLRRILD